MAPGLADAAVDSAASVLRLPGEGWFDDENCSGGPAGSGPWMERDIARSAFAGSPRRRYRAIRRAANWTWSWEFDDSNEKSGDWRAQGTGVGVGSCARWANWDSIRPRRISETRGGD